MCYFAGALISTILSILCLFLFPQYPEGFLEAQAKKEEEKKKQEKVKEQEKESGKGKGKGKGKRKRSEGRFNFGIKDDSPFTMR